MGRSEEEMLTMAHNTLLCVWLSFFAVAALRDFEEDGSIVSSLASEAIATSDGTGVGAKYGFYCTSKGDSSPQYAYNDKNCLANGKTQQCGEVWCCGGPTVKAGLYSCQRSARVKASLCTGIKKPSCSGPKPMTGGKAQPGTAGSGCRDSHDAICQAAKLYGHCKHASYGSMCRKSCGKCGVSSKASTKSLVKKILNKAKAKKAIKKVKKHKGKKAKKTLKKKMKK